MTAHGFNRPDVVLSMPTLKPEDIAEAVLFLATRPERVEVR